MYENQCPSCIKSNLEEFSKSEYLNKTSVLNEVIRDFKAGNDTSGMDKLYGLYKDNFEKAIGQVFKFDTANTKYRDYLYKFRANTIKFSAYKASYAKDALNKALKSGINDFDTKAKGILRTFNRFQVTEYNTAVARCRTARQFVNFDNNSDIYTNLEWIRTRSADPRELHLSFVGLVLPKGDPFFKKHSPGELYNCKCNLRQTDKIANYKAVKEIAQAKGLEGNPYYTREIFTEEHPYFKKFAGSQTEMDSFVSREIFKQFENADGFFVHPLQDIHASDFADLKLLASYFKGLGLDSYIMPKLSVSRGDLYKYLFEAKGVHPNKMPDLMIGDFFFELESYIGTYSKNSLENMLSRAVKQSDKIIIDLRGSADSLHYVKKRIENRIRDGANITEAWGLMDIGIVQIY